LVTIETASLSLQRQLPYVSTLIDVECLLAC